MVNISNYRLEHHGGFYYVISLEASCCPICGKALILRGYRQRKLIDSIDGNEQKIILVIRRLRCGECNRIHHELPDRIVPYKRHCAETIEKITTGSDEAVCENRFASRILAWWSAVRPYFLNILKSLAQKHGTFYEDPPAFKGIVRAAVNSNNWVFAHSI